VRNVRDIRGFTGKKSRGREGDIPAFSGMIPFIPHTLIRINDRLFGVIFT